MVPRFRNIHLQGEMAVIEIWCKDSWNMVIKTRCRCLLYCFFSACFSSGVSSLAASGRCAPIFLCQKGFFFVVLGSLPVTLKIHHSVSECTLMIVEKQYTSVSSND